MFIKTNTPNFLPKASLLRTFFFPPYFPRLFMTKCTIIMEFDSNQTSTSIHLLIAHTGPYNYQLGGASFLIQISPFHLPTIHRAAHFPRHCTLQPLGWAAAPGDGVDVRRKSTSRTHTGQKRRLWSNADNTGEAAVREAMKSWYLPKSCHHVDWYEQPFSGAPFLRRFSVKTEPLYAVVAEKSAVRKIIHPLSGFSYSSYFDGAIGLRLSACCRSTRLEVMLVATVNSSLVSRMRFFALPFSRNAKLLRRHCPK